MLETIIRDYLSEKLDVPVECVKPKTKPEQYIMLHRIDGGQTDHISAGTLSVICISKSSLYDALLLSNKTKTILNKSIELHQISSAKLGGESGEVNSSERGYEYELIYNFYYYEEE